MWAKRYFSRYVLLAIMLVFWHAALPYLHMAAANRPGAPLLICTGTGIQILISAPDSAKNPNNHPFELASKTLPCIVGAHAHCLLTQTRCDLAAVSSDWVSLLASYLPFVAPKLFHFMFARGGAPPNLS